MKLIPVLALVLLIAFCGAPKAIAADGKDASAELFNSSTIRTLRLSFSKAQWDAIEPTDLRQGQNGPMRRMEYPVVHGAVEFEGKTYSDVGIRYKGNSSYMMARNSLKKSFKLDFNQFVDQSFYGLSSVNLNNNAGDPTEVRETLGYELFAAAKVPAARTTLLRVELSVPGKYDHQFIGLYTLVEDVGKHFLKSRFGSSKGLLVKPEMSRGLPLISDKWEEIARVYAPRTDGDKSSKQRLIDFLKLVHQADDATFDKQIESMLDCDEFLRFLAVNAVTSNLDSLLLSGHNFYIHVPHKRGLIEFIPWDLNECFGGFSMGNSPETVLKLSVTHPYAGENKLIERLLALPRFQERYRQIISELTSGAFSQTTMTARIDALNQLTADLRDREKQAGISVGPPGRPPGVLGDANATPGRPNNPGGRAGFPGGGPRVKPELKAFVAARNQSISEQLAGNDKGLVPTNARGPGGFGGGPGMRPNRPNGPPGFEPRPDGPPGSGPRPDGAPPRP